MKKLCVALAALASLCFASNAQAMGIPLTLTQLPGFAVGSDATAVWVADLNATGLTSIDAVIIADTSGGAGGATGELSGSDIDAVLIGTTLAANGAGIPAASVAIDYSMASLAAGAQRPPMDPALFNVPGGSVDNVAATPGAFDAGIAPFSGFFSMGDGGVYTVALANIDPSVDRYLYVGEVTGNGESFEAFATPEPSTFVLAGLAGLGLLLARRRTR